jgi:hypothetical protein
LGSLDNRFSLGVILSIQAGNRINLYKNLPRLFDQCDIAQTLLMTQITQFALGQNSIDEKLKNIYSGMSESQNCPNGEDPANFATDVINSKQLAVREAIDVTNGAKCATQK